MASDLQIQGEVVVNSEKAESAFDRVGDKAQQMANEVATSANKAGQAVDKIGDGAGASAQKLTKAQSLLAASIAKSTEQLQLLGKTASQQFEFKMAAKGFDPALFEPALQKLREVEAQAQAAQRAATGSLDSMGMSAKQTAAALRGVPAQFQDIIVSLQGGQAPMTVLLQQGSQLTTMFGGVGGAAKALGTYVAGLVNPFTVAAAAAAALGVAMYSINSKDAALRELSVQLIGTGRASISATEDIKALVEQLNVIPGVSKASATAIITEFAKVSGVGADLFRGLGSSVADFAAATGTDLPTAAKKLAEAFADPAKGAKTLEESLGTLTAAQLLTIGKMAAIGDKAGAQAALMDALKQATSGLAEQGMTLLGKATDKLSNAWDTMTTSVGNSSAFRTANDWLAKLITKVAELTTSLANVNAPSWLKYLPGVGPAIGSLGLIPGSGPGGSRSVSGRVGSSEGGASGSWEPPESEVEKQVKAALDATKSYESQAAAMDKLRGVASQAKSALKSLEDQNRGNSVEAATLRERIAGVNEKLAEMAKKGSQGEKGGDPFASQRESAKEWARYVEQFAKAADDATAKSEGLTKSQATLAEYLQSTAYQNASEPMREVALQAAYAAIKQEQLNEQTKIAAQVAKSAATAHAQYIAELSRGTAAAQQQIDRMRLEEEAASIASRGYASLAEAIELVTIARLEEKRDGLLGNEDAYLAVQKEIDARKELLGVIRTSEARKASEDAAKQAQADWERAAQSINNSITDALLRGFESGKSFAKNFRDTLVNMFKTLVLRPIISFIVNPIAGALTGMLGFGGSAAAAAAGGGSGIGTAINGASLLGRVGGMGTGFMNGLSAWGAEGSVTGVLSNPGLYTGAELAGALAPIALGIGGLITLIGATKGETRTGGQFGVAYDGKVTNNRRGETYTYQGQQYDRDFSNGRRDALVNGQAYRLEGDPVAQESAIRDAVAGTAKGIGDILKSLGSSVTVTGFSAGLETSGKGRGGVFAGGTLSNGATFGESGKGDNYAGTLYEKFSTNSPDFKQALADFSLDLKQSTIQALQQVDDIPKSVQKMLKDVDAEALTDEAANTLLTAINEQIVGVEQFRAALGAMGLKNFADMAFDAAAAIAEASGGFANLQNNLKSYYENYYSEAEKTALKTKLVKDQLEAVGLQMPKTREEFKALVEKYMAMGEEGAKVVAVLLDLSGSFADITPKVATLADAFRVSGDTIKGILDDALANAGSAAEASQMASDAFVESIYSSINDAMTTSLSGLIMGAIQPMIDSLVASATTASTSLATGGATGGSAMATGGAAGGSAVATGGAAAATVMAGVIEQARAQISAFATILNDPEIQRVIREIGGIVGNVAGVAYGGASAYRPAKVSSGSAGGGGGGGGAKGINDYADALKNLGKTVESEIKRLRGITESESDFAQEILLAKFTTATAQARAGDKDALASLADLSQSIEQATAATAVTNIENIRIRAWLADSMEKTLKALGLSVPAFDVGTNYVPGDMLAQVHKGERIIPAADNTALMDALSGSGGNAELVAEVRALREKLDAIESNTNRSARNTDGVPQFVDQFDNVTEAGNAVRFNGAVLEL
jgi:hypothetical protein